MLLIKGIICWCAHRCCLSSNSCAGMFAWIFLFYADFWIYCCWGKLEEWHQFQKLFDYFLDCVVDRHTVSYFKSRGSICCVEQGACMVSYMLSAMGRERRSCFASRSYIFILLQILSVSGILLQVQRSCRNTVFYEKLCKVNSLHFRDIHASEVKFSSSQ